VKYVLTCMSYWERSPTNKFHRYHLTDTFDVLVGTAPNRQRFTVHHDLITQRSEFFRAARSRRWTKRNKPTKLVDEQPHMFSAYMNCLYLGADFMIERPATLVIEGSISEDDKEKANKNDEEDTMRFLVDLYILADKLLDPISANLIIDKLIAFVDTLSWMPGPITITYVYNNTVDGNPLRRLCRDWRIHEIAHGWPMKTAKTEWNLPHEFLQDLLIENARLQLENPKGQLGEVFDTIMARRPKSHYHQKVE
jgi:hypothetical protein